MVDPLTVSVGLQLAGSVLGFGSDRKARKRQKRAEALNAQRSAIMNIQNRRAAYASLRRQEAQRTVAAMATGMAGGSGDRATSSSLQAQGISAIARQQQQIELGGQVNAAIGSANRASNRANDYRALGNIGANIARRYSGSGKKEEDKLEDSTRSPSLPTQDPHSYY